MDIEKPYFLYAGGMKARKNIRNVVRAFDTFCAENRASKMQLVLAGGVGGQFVDSIQQLVSERGLAGRVHFVGFVTPGQLSYLYQNAIGFVFPSRVEGFGMVALEAMACGLPTIASATGALAEAVGNGALTVPPEKPDAIAAAMHRIATDAPYRAELIVRGKARAAEFTWENTAKETAALIHSIVRRKD